MAGLLQAVVNAPGPTAVVYNAAAKEMMGTQNIVDKRTMASKDMGFFLDEIPGYYFFIGASNEAAGINFPHHHPRFTFDERAMIDGVAVWGEAAAGYVVRNGHTSESLGVKRE